MTAIDLPLSALGATVRVAASGVGDLAGAAHTDAAVQGRSVVPPAPVHVISVLLPSGDAVVRWTRRSRGGWRWIDGVDAPLGEERELYRVTIAPENGAARLIETAICEAVVGAGELAAGAVRVSVRQIGSNGESAAGSIDLPMS